MKTRYFICSLVSLLVCATSFAQNHSGIELFNLGELTTAKQLFEGSKGVSPDISYYYLGEIALKEGKNSEALEYFNKGINADSDAVFCSIGKVKIEQKASPKELSKELKNIQKKNKKDIAVLVQIAKAYWDVDMIADAESTLSAARSIDKNSALPYLLGGDILLKKGNIGEAASQYEQAYTFDPSCVVAYIKNALVYETTNSTTSINTLKSGLEANPNNTLINKYLADIYYHHGFYQQAIDAYNLFFQSNNQSLADLKNYAASFYFTDNYEKALEIIQEVLAVDPNNRVMNRLLMYTFDKQKKFDKALDASEKLFALSPDDTQTPLLANDYIVYGDILRENGDLDKAIVQYEKAIALDTDKLDVLKDIAGKLVNANRFVEAGKLFDRYIELAKETESSDYLLMGIAYYQAAVKASKDEIEKDQTKLVEYTTKAEAAFSMVIDLVPDSYQGYYWRANVKTLLDADLSKGLANDDYLKMIEVIKSNDLDSNINKLVEGYRYLSIYYLYQFDSNKKDSDKQSAKKYAEQVLELNSNDDTAQKILEVLSN